MDLAQFFVQRRRPSFCKSLRLLVEHFLVPIDLERLSEANDLQKEWKTTLKLFTEENQLRCYLDRHVKRYWNDGVEDNCIREEHKHPDDGGTLDVLGDD